MKSYFGFALFALLLCLSDARRAVIPDNFNCNDTIYVPEYIVPHCPKLSVGNAVSEYITEAVVDASLTVLADCEKNVDELCTNLPAPMKKYKGQGVELCKAQLVDHMCDNINQELDEIYCSYKRTISEILKKPEKWERGHESDLCKLFQKNDILCSTITAQMCELIEALLPKSNCHRITKKIFCEETPKVNII